MAAQSENSPAVAATEDLLSSSAVAGESSASGSGDWSKVDLPHNEETHVIATVTTNLTEVSLVGPNSTPGPNPTAESMEAHSQASPVPGGTSEAKEATTEANEAESQLSASVGKAAGASSAVAEKAPPAVEESANQGILPEQMAARPAPGSAAKAPPPPVPNVRPHGVPAHVSVVPGEPSQEPAVAGGPRTPPVNTAGPPT